jgi:DNA repair protein RecO (recombination protein O)
VLHKVKGVVFRFTRYGETSVIVTIFTDQFGLQSYIVNGVRSRSSKSKIALFQPLTLLELVVYHRENANINRIKEMKCIHPYNNLHLDVSRSAIAMFITEVINKAVKDQSHAEDLCEFLITSLITLDSMTTHVHNFHLIFMLKLSRFLGFGAQNINEVLGGRVTELLIENAIGQMISGDYLTQVALTNPQRREALDLLIQFYNEHSGTLGELKSVQVLREILA